MKLSYTTCLIFLLCNTLSAQILKKYTFSADSVHVFTTPNPVNGYYRPYDISKVTKPMYAEPFVTNVSFPVLAQDIYLDAGNYANTIFGGDDPGVYGWGYTSTSTIINDIFSINDFPIILEADFFNRSSFGSYNESYFWLGNSDYTNFNPSNSILPSADVQQGVIIGGLPERSIISHGRNFLLPSIALLNETHNFANYNKWYKLKVILDVTEDGRLVIYNIFIDDNCVMSDPIIVEKSDDLNLNSFKLAICVDDFAKDFKVTKNAFLFQLPNVVACENEIISLNADFDQELCLDLSYNWSLPGSNIGFSSLKSPSNIKYQNPGNYSGTLTISNGQFTKNIPFEVFVEAGSSQISSQTICSSDSIFFNNQWITSSGTYQEVFQAQNGCDSIINLTVTHLDTIRTSSNVTLCQGDSIQINEQWVYDEGNFINAGSSVNGCDSISTITVEVIPQVDIRDTVYLCKGDSILINDSWYYGAQDVTYLDQNSFCPTNVSTKVEELPSYSFNDNFSICPLDSIRYQGKWIIESGQYKFNFQTERGCDSVFVLNAKLLPLPDEPSFIPDCEDNMYNLSVEPDLDWSFIWSNGTTVSPTVYSNGETAYISYVHNSENCRFDYRVVLPAIPSDEDVPLFSDTIVYPGKLLKYKVDTDTNFWSIDWYQNDNIACESCEEYMVKTLSGTEVELIFYHISGCEYYRNFSVGVDASQGLYIPNIFAPKSTLGNALWLVKFPECFTPTQVKIYDRWGNLVSNSENPLIVSWDGTYNGRDAEQGVYTFVIHYTDLALSPKVITGDFTLIR